jgi:hypothetical protein
MFRSLVAALLVAIAPPGPPAADSPLKAQGEALVYSSYDLARDEYRLEARGAPRPTITPSLRPFQFDIGPGNEIVRARRGFVTVWHGRVVESDREIEIRGERTAKVTKTGVELDGRPIFEGAALGLSFTSTHLGWWSGRRAWRYDVSTHELESAPGPRRPSGFALLEDGRIAWIEREGEDGRLRFGQPPFVAAT